MRYRSAARRRRPDLPRELGSQWRENHEYLITVVTRGKPERAGPATSHCPAEPDVEVLKPDPAAYGKVKLLQAHL